MSFSSKVFLSKSSQDATSRVFQLLKSSSSLSLIRRKSSRIDSVRPFSNFFQQNESSIPRLKEQHYKENNHNKWDERKQNGTLELTFGFSILAYLGVDHLLNKLKVKEREYITQQLRLAVHSDELKRMAAAVSDAASVSMTTANIVKTEANGIQNYSNSNHPSSYRVFSDNDEVEKMEINEKNTIFHCRVRRVPRSFDGTRSLRFVEEGDILEVLEEGIGPGGGYNLCRKKRVINTTKASDVKTNLNMVHTVNHLSISDNDLSWLHHPSKYREGWFPQTCLEKI